MKNDELTLGQELVSAMEEVMEMELGKEYNEMSKHTVTVKPVDILTPIEMKYIRLSLNMSTSIMGDVIGADQTSIQYWESGKRKPGKAALRMYNLIKSKPGIIKDIISFKETSSNKKILSKSKNKSILSLRKKKIK